MSLFELKEQYKRAIKNREIPRYCTFEEYADMYGDEEDVGDYISDLIGFCHFGYDLED